MMAIDIKQIWRAGRVRRWHMNPDLADTVDPVDGHSARVARLWLALFGMNATAPVIARMTVAALTHDDEEIFIGDLDRPAKDANRSAYSKIEAFGKSKAAKLWEVDFRTADLLSPNEVKQLKLCDGLDAYLWAKHHRGNIVYGFGWPEAAMALCENAKVLGVHDQVSAAIFEEAK